MKEIFFRLDRCMACRSCQMACAVEHSSSKNLFSAIGESPKPKYRLYVEQAKNHNVPLTCRDCDPAPCIEACISGAMYKDDKGVVLAKEDRCVGCWTCIMVCPYGVVGRIKEQKIAIKCDKCPDQDEPACVKACPTKALVYMEPEKFEANVRRTAAGMIIEEIDSIQQKK